MGSAKPALYDRIAAFALAERIDVVPSATAVRIGRLPRPSLAVLGSGDIPLGAEASKAFVECLNGLRPFYSVRELKRIEQLAQIARAFGTDFQRDPTFAKNIFHPLAGVLGRSYYYGAFIPRRGESEALGILRSLLLRIITRSALDKRVTQAAKTIRDILTVQPTYAFDGNCSSILAEQWHLAIEPAALADLLRPYFKPNETLASAFAGQALDTKCCSTDPPSSAPEEPHSDDSGKPRPPPSPGRPSARASPGGLTSVPTYVPPPPELGAPPTDEIPVEDMEGFQLAFALDLFQEEDKPLELPTKRETTLAIFEFDQLTRHHLEGALLPDSDRVLSSGESARVWEWLSTRLTSNSSRPALEVIAHICVALMLVTGRRRNECIHAIRNFLGDELAIVDGSLRISNTGWVATIPELPRLRGLPENWFDKPAREFNLPFAKSLANALRVLACAATREIFEQVGASESWANTWAEVRDGLRSEVPRFTETRLMHTLPVAVFLMTGHLREAQWLSGSSLEHSVASSHYYGTPATRLRTIYTNALTSFGIEVAENMASAHTLVGAPRAAIRWESARTAFSAIVSRTAGGIRLSKAPLSNIIDGTAALGLYLAILFGAITANRFTAPIAHMTRRHFLSPRGSGSRWTLALVADKTTEPELDARICVLPGLFTRQLDAYIRQLERLQRQLEKNVGENAPLLEAVLGALCGEGALWFAVTATESGYATQPLTPHAIASAWPEWAIPLPLLRHLFASNAVTFGLTGSDIALQMGHSIGGTPFNECDPDSPLEFADRLSDGLERYCRALGCELIGTVSRYDPPAELAAPSADSVISAYQELAKSRRDRAAQSRIQPNNTERLRGFELARACIEHTAADNEWLMSPRAIQTLLDEIKDEPLPMQQAAREALNAHLAKVSLGRNTRHLRRAYVPALRIRDRAYSPLALVNLEATRWALELEKRCLKVLDRGLARNATEATSAATVLLLALYGAGTTSDRLLRLMDPAIPLHTFEDFNRGVIAEIPLSSKAESNDSPECQLLTGDLVPLVAFQRRNRKQPPTARQLETALRSEPELRQLLPKANGSTLINCLLLIGLVRQVFLPGTRSAWERGELKTVGPALERVYPLFGIQAPSEFTPACQTPEQAKQPPARALGLDEYRSLRRLVRDLTDSSKRRAAAAQLPHRHQDLTHGFGATSLIALLAALVVYLRDERRLAASTVYDYLVSIGRRLITHVGAGNIFDIEIDDIETTLRQIAIEERSGRERRGIGVVAPAIAHFARILARVGFDLDLARVFDGLDVETPRQPGYFAVQSEIDAIAADLAAATDHALDTLALDKLADTAAVAEAAIRIQMSAGLRLRETAGLMRRDCQLQSSLSVHVHLTRRRGLKTLSSQRLVSVPVDSDSTNRIQALLPRLARSSNRDSDLLLAAPDMGIAAIARTISTAFRRHAFPHLTGRHARSHIARHNNATAAIIATHPAHAVSPLSPLKPIAGLDTTLARLRPVRHVPRYLQLRYLSRQLGHATPRTTLTWYAHSVSLLHAQVPPWTGLPRHTEAALLGYRSTHIDRWRTHRGTADATLHLNRWKADWLPATLHRRQPNPPVAVIETPVVSLTVELTGRVALYVREGVTMTTGAYHCGVSIERYRLVVDLLGEHDRGHRLNYLTSRRRRARSRLRIPRAHDQGAILRAVDALMLEGRLTRDDLRRWLLWQLARGKANDLIFDSSTDAIFDLLSEHKRMPRRTEYSPRLLLQKADRQHFLLALSVVCLRASPGGGLEKQRHLPY